MSVTPYAVGDVRDIADVLDHGLIFQTGTCSIERRIIGCVLDLMIRYTRWSIRCTPGHSGKASISNHYSHSHMYKGATTGGRRRGQVPLNMLIDPNCGQNLYCPPRPLSNNLWTSYVRLKYFLYVFIEQSIISRVSFQLYRTRLNDLKFEIPNSPSSSTNRSSLFLRLHPIPPQTFDPGLCAHGHVCSRPTY